MGVFGLTGCAHPPAGDHHPHGSEGHPHGSEAHSLPHRFEKAEQWAPRFEDPARDVWQKPDEVIAALKLEPSSRVADIGAATGYFPVRLARALPLGKVWGVDIEPDMVRYLNERAGREGLPNLKAVLGTPEDPQIPEKVDLVLVVDTFHHIANRPTYFENLKRQVATDGRLAIIDFKPDSPIGPPPEHRLPAEQIETELKRAGWTRLEQHDFLPYQHFLLFSPVR